MDNTSNEISPKDIEEIYKPPEVFVFVNPLTGKHAKYTLTNKLAVFRDESVARQWENISKALKSMVGYFITWEEMLDIAAKQTDGLYEYFANIN